MPHLASPSEMCDRGPPIGISRDLQAYARHGDWSIDPSAQSNILTETPTLRTCLLVSIQEEHVSLHTMPSHPILKQ